MILPPPDHAALMLDLDGTLLDIAPTPDAVRVAPGLADAIRTLRQHLGDALAIVTGRPIDQVDGLLPGIPYAIAGEHGGAIRRAPDAAVTRPALPEPPSEWLPAAAHLIGQHPGALLEQKQRGFVLHYRNAPDAGLVLETAVHRLIESERAHFQVLASLMAWEVRPRGADKGVAVRTLAAEAPFAGRQPIFLGDDVTDEDGMEAARALGGAGLRVDRWFGEASDVRAWLAASAASLAAGGTWAPLPLQG